MGYHTGTVWPNDNALVASGLARDGHSREALEIRLHDLEVAGTTLDIAVSQDGDSVAVKVLRRDGEAPVVVIE